MKMVAIVLSLTVMMLSGCATYHEPGYNPGSSIHQSEGRYTDDQYAADMNRARVTAQRQREYDRHQNSVQRRSQSTNRELRNNIGLGGLLLGGSLLIRNRLVH